MLFLRDMGFPLDSRTTVKKEKKKERSQTLNPNLHLSFSRMHYAGLGLQPSP